MARQAVGLQFQLVAQPSSRFDGAKRQWIKRIWLERRAIRNRLWPRFLFNLAERESGEYEKCVDTYGESHFDSIHNLLEALLKCLKKPTAAQRVASRTRR